MKPLPDILSELRDSSRELHPVMPPSRVAQRARMSAWTLSDRFRVLPPVAGVIPQRAVLAGLMAALRRSTDPDRIQQQLTGLTGLTQWVFTSSGRSALSLLLISLRKRRPGCNEVIIPAYTSYSVPAAVVRAGLKVRLCDIEESTLGLCPTALERVITTRTLCVVPNHLYGVPCRIAAVCALARRHGVPVVEDAAQAMGIVSQGRPGGACGDAAIFSLSRGKTLPAAGGGVIGTNDVTWADTCRRVLRNVADARPATGLLGAVETALMAIFIRPRLYGVPAALPFLRIGASVFDPVFDLAPMSRFQQALFEQVLPGIAPVTAGRRAQAGRLQRAFTGLQDRLQMIGPLNGDEGVWLRVPVLLPNGVVRNSVLRELQRRGLGATGGYPLPLARISELAPDRAGSPSQYPIAESVSHRLITLPTHAWVTDRDRQRMVKVFEQCMP